MQFVIGHKGATQRTPQEQTALVVRILDELHVADIGARAKAALGERKNVIGQLDVSRNDLAAYVSRLGTAYLSPPLVDELDERLAALLGDDSARVTVERYAAAGGRPMPTALGIASAEALRYRLGAGFAGLLLGWSDRESRVTLDVVTPDDLDLVYASDTPSEPTVIRQRGVRVIGGESTDTIDESDLRNEDAPRYRVLVGDKDVTQAALGRTFDGADYPWRYTDGRPFHRIVVTGHPRYRYRTNALVEVTLIVSVRWTAWGAAVDDAGFPQRNVRGLALDGQDSDAESPGTGTATGPETVLRWHDVDPERPGDHWQDGPGYDPRVIAEAIRTYEVTALSALGVPVSLEATGGEPTETEREAMAELVATTFPECRRFASEALRRSAAIATRESGQGPFRDTPYSTLFRSEVDEALRTAAARHGKAADTALNGAQVQAAQGIVQAVAQRQLPRDTGVAMLTEFFRLAPDIAERLVGTAGQSFVPTAPSDAQPPSTPGES